jgi:uncharacterized protein YgbK (DUF1537 family)
VDWPAGKGAYKRGLVVWRKALARGLVLGSLRDRKAIDRRHARATGETRLRRLSAAALALGVARGQAACLLTGGHTAEIFYEMAGLEGNWIYGELQAGMPWGLALGPEARAWVATKPGGFGDKQAFLRFFESIRKGG